MTEPEHVLKQQPENLRGGFVTKVVTGAIIVSALSVLVAGVLLVAWTGRLTGPPIQSKAPAAETPAGIHQTNFRGAPDGLEQEAAALESLTRYGYVDPRHRIAEIPIERAMDWLVNDARRGPITSPDPATTLDAGENPDGGR